MKQEQQTGKKIISKGAYAARVGERVGTGAWGCGLLLLAAFFGLFAVGMTCASVLAIIDVYLHHSNGFALDRLSPVVACLLFLMMAKFLWKRGNANLELSTQKMYVVPLTRANAADLPATKSLVRASQEPTQAQEGVLLRAASGEAQAGQEGLLLRASVGGQE